MQELTPLEIFQRLWRRKFLAFASVAGCVALSWLYLLNAKEQFQIEANLLLQLGAHGLRTEQVHNGRSNSELVATQSEILLSRELLTRAASQTEQQRGGLSGPTDAIVENLGEGLVVKPVVGTHILNVSLRWQDAAEGQSLVEQVIREYELLLSDLNQGGQVEALTTLAETEKEVRAELADLQQQYRSLRKQSSLVGNEGKDLETEQTMLREFAVSYAQAQSRRVGLENRLAAVGDAAVNQDVIVSTPETAAQLAEYVSTTNALGLPGQYVATLGSVDNEAGVTTASASSSPRTVKRADWNAMQMFGDVNDGTLQERIAIQQQLLEAETRRQQLSGKFLENHPEVKAVEEQIKRWNERLQSLVDSAPRALELQVQAAKLEEESLRLRYEDELKKARSLDQDRLEQDHLKQQITQVQTIHDSISSQLVELRLNHDVTTEGGADLRITVLDKPQPDLNPVWPEPKLVLGGGLLIGLMGTFLLVLIPVSRT